jgi:hypothetical protein
LNGIAVLLTIADVEIIAVLVKRGVHNLVELLITEVGRTFYAVVDRGGGPGGATHVGIAELGPIAKEFVNTLRVVGLVDQGTRFRIAEVSRASHTVVNLGRRPKEAALVLIADLDAVAEI